MGIQTLSFTIYTVEQKLNVIKSQKKHFSLGGILRPLVFTDAYPDAFIGWGVFKKFCLNKKYFVVKLVLLWRQSTQTEIKYIN